MAVNGVNNVNAAQITQASSSQVQRASFKPDLEKAESIRAEQRQWIEGQRQIMKQANGQIIGLTLANAQNNENINNLYNLASIAGIKGISGLESYFSMFVRDGSGNFSVDFSGVSPQVQEQLISKAKEDVSENGFWGVKKTSERIFNFAEALTGGDPSKMAKMQQVVEKAFESVGKIFGGLDRMPEISRQTYDAVKQRFADFAAATAANKQTTDLEAVKL